MMRAFDMSKHTRVIATEGRVRGDFVVHGADRGVFKIEVLDLVLYNEDRSWGRIINANEFDVVIGDRDDRTPRVGKKIHPDKVADVEEFRPLIDAVLLLVVEAFENGVGSVVDSTPASSDAQTGTGHA